MPAEGWAALGLADRPLGPGFRRRMVTLEPGESRPYDPREWKGAFVLLQAGSVELVGRTGGRRRFATGANLWLSELPLRSIYNPGDVPAVLVAISRKADRKKSARPMSLPGRPHLTG